MRATAEPGVIDNQFSLLTLRLPVSEGDPIQRLRSTSKRMNALRSSIEPIANFFVFKLFGFVPAGISRPLLHFVANKSSAVLTNVPGPAEMLQVDGFKIHDLYIYTPHHTTRHFTSLHLTSPHFTSLQFIHSFPHTSVVFCCVVLCRMFFVPQVGSIGLGLSILSYAGSVRVGVTADEAVCAEPQALIDHFREEFERLAQAAEAADGDRKSN